VRPPKGAEAVAFARRLNSDAAIAIAPTLTRALAGDAFAIGDVWKDAMVELPEATEGAWLNVLTGERLTVTRAGNGPSGLRMRDALRTLPVALLVTQPPA
jgi:maltooligosyltrehalose synthase